jgi:tryptophan synthase alpha subunit
VAQLGASGAIVASALVDLIDRAEDPIAASRDYLREMKAGGVSALAR